MKATPYDILRLDRTFIGDMLNIQNEYFDSEDFEKDWFYPYTKEELEEIFSDETNLVHGAFIGKYLLAFRIACIRGQEWDEIKCVLPDPYKGKKFVLMNGVMVSKGFTGQGLQKKLIMEAADMTVVNTFVAAAHPDNMASLKALKTIGFKEVGILELYNSEYERLLLVKE